MSVQHGKLCRIEINRMEGDHDEQYGQEDLLYPDSPEQDVNAGYQSVVDALYKLIYRFGTPETREQLSRTRGYTEEE